MPCGVGMAGAAGAASSATAECEWLEIEVVVIVGDALVLDTEG